MDPVVRLLSKLPDGWKSSTRLIESKEHWSSWARVRGRIKAWSGKTLAEVLTENAQHGRIAERHICRAIMAGYLCGVGIKMMPHSQNEGQHNLLLPHGWTNQTRLVVRGCPTPKTKKVQDRVKAWAGKTVDEVLQKPRAPGLTNPGRALLQMIDQGYFAQNKVSASNVPVRAFTICGAQRCWLVLRRKKVIENRTFKIPPGWYALHCSKRPCSCNLTKKQRISCGKTLPPVEHELAPHFCGQILGAVHVGSAGSYADCASLPWAERQEGVNGKSWCMMITKVVDLRRFGLFPVSGDRKVWRLAAETRRELARRLGKRAK